MIIEWYIFENENELGSHGKWIYIKNTSKFIPSVGCQYVIEWLQTVFGFDLCSWVKSDCHA